MTTMYEGSFLGLDWGAIGVGIAVLGLAAALWQLHQLVVAGKPPKITLKWVSPPEIERLGNGAASGACSLRCQIRNEGPNLITVHSLTMRPRLLVTGSTVSETWSVDQAGLRLNPLETEQRLAGEWNFDWSRYSPSEIWAIGSPVSEGIPIFTILKGEGIDLPPFEIRVCNPAQAQEVLNRAPRVGTLRLIFNVHSDRRSYSAPLDLVLSYS